MMYMCVCRRMDGWCMDDRCTCMYAWINDELKNRWDRCKYHIWITTLRTYKEKGITVIAFKLYVEVYFSYLKSNITPLTFQTSLITKVIYIDIQFSAVSIPQEQVYMYIPMYVLILHNDKML